MYQKFCCLNILNSVKVVFFLAFNWQCLIYVVFSITLNDILKNKLSKFHIQFTVMVHFDNPLSLGYCFPCFLGLIYWTSQRSTSFSRYPTQCSSKGALFILDGIPPVSPVNLPSLTWLHYHLLFFSVRYKQSFITNSIRLQFRRKIGKEFDKREIMSILSQEQASLPNWKTLKNNSTPEKLG